MIDIQQMIEFTASFIESLIPYLLLWSFFKARDKKIKIYIIINALIVTTIIFIFNSIDLYSDLLLPLSIAYVSLTSMRLFQGKLRSIIAVTSFYYVFLILLDIFGILTISFVTHNAEYGMKIIEGYSSTRIQFICAVKLMLIMMYMIALHFKKKLSRIVSDYDMWILLLAVLGYGAGIYFSNVGFIAISLLMITNWFFFLIIIFMLLVIFIIYVNYRDSIEKKNMIEVRNKMLAKNYSELKEFLDSRAKAIHDFKNHINLISKYIREENNKAAMEYIENVGIPLIEGGNEVWSGHEIIDFILNTKIKEAHKCDIEVNVNVKIYSCEIKDNDLCSILSNLLDNAIEASSQINDKKRWIDVRIKNMNDMLMIKIKNNFQNKPNQKGGRLESIKKDKRLHGIGLDIVDKIVKKYDGYMKYDYTKDEFDIIITLAS